LGAAIEKSDPPFVVFSDKQSRQGMIPLGLPPSNINGYVAMNQAIRSGKTKSDFTANPHSTQEK